MTIAPKKFSSTYRKDLRGSLNTVFMVRVAPDDSQWVWKPESGRGYSYTALEKMTRREGGALREVGAYIISEYLGLGLVPETVYAIVDDDGPGSLQRWVKGRTEEAWVEAGIDFSQVTGHAAVMQTAAPFNYFIGGVDHHVGNRMVKLSRRKASVRRAHMIDNTEIAGTNPRHPAGSFKAAMIAGNRHFHKWMVDEGKPVDQFVFMPSLPQPLSATFMAAMDKLESPANAAAFRSRVRPYLTEAEIDAMFHRRTVLYRWHNWRG